MAQLAIHTTLTIKTTDCITCGVVIALVSELYDQRLKDHNNFYCPNGHHQHFVGETAEQKLQKELEAQKRRTEMALNDARSEREARKRDVRVLKGKLTRIKNRVGRGACPCCNRFFSDLSRHMESKHPEYKSAETTGEELSAGEEKK